MTTTYRGAFTSNGDGTGTWSLDSGDSGSFSLVDYLINSDGSVSYRQRFYRSNGSTFGDVIGIAQGSQSDASGRYSGIWTLTENNGLYTFSNYRNGILITSGSFQSLTGSPFTTIFDRSYSVSTLIQTILGSSISSNPLSTDVADKKVTVNASSWSGEIKINFAAKASNNGDALNAKQIDIGATGFGSVIQGGIGNDVIMGKAGWDIIDGDSGNDLIRGGNGRDILIGGIGADEIHGDFGWNTYKSEKDGYADLIAIKSDQSLVNWIYGKAGNNADGSKCDIIEGLDSIDRIRIIGVATKDLTFANTSAKELNGIGIYANGALEALYTGGDLSLAQIQSMTTGDDSAAAMANQINSYGWTTNPNSANFAPNPQINDPITGAKVSGTWRTVGPTLEEGGLTWNFGGTFTILSVNSGNSPFSTYYSFVKDPIDPKSDTWRITGYADHNRNNIFGDSVNFEDVVGDGVLKVVNRAAAPSIAEIANTPSTEVLAGTFESSGNTIGYFVGNQLAAEATFPKSPWTTLS